MAPKRRNRDCPRPLGTGVFFEDGLFCIGFFLFTEVP